MMPSSKKGRALRLIAIERTVSSLAPLVSFYQEALGFELLSMSANHDPAWRTLLGGSAIKAAQLQLGRQKVCLTEFETSGAAYPADTLASDLSFQHVAIVAADIHKAYNRLHGYELRPITSGGPLQLPPNTGNVLAYKFRDPDGHPLEFISFPSGVGNRAWEQKKDTPLTLGFDHTAISVSNVEASLHFYCTLLGMSVVGMTTNSGATQDRLDGLENDIVDVIALEFTGAHLPHLELLAYRQPAPRSPMETIRPRDLAGDRMVVQVDDLVLIRARLTPGTFEEAQMSSGQPLMLVRDPDGHMIFLTP